MQMTSDFNLACKQKPIAMFLVTSPIVVNLPTRGLLAVETMYDIVQRLAKLNIKRNMTRNIAVHVYIRKCPKFSPLNLEEVSPELYLLIFLQL